MTTNDHRSPPENVIPLPSREEEIEFDEETLETLREALDDLRREIRLRVPDQGLTGSAASEAISDLDIVGLVDGLRKRLATLGMRERSVEVDDFGLDEELVQRADPVLDWMQSSYWRVDVEGLEHLPDASPALFVSNRAGLLPWDGVMLAHVIHNAAPRFGRPRPMLADWLVTLPFVQAFAARMGGVRACRENADRLLRTGRSVIAFPEGAKGATKTFRERYRLKRFGRGGVVRAAIENGVPIVPVGLVGPEEAHPVLFKSHRAARWVGLPFLPVTPTFPLLGPLGAIPLPTKWVMVFGEPMTPSAPTDPAAEALVISQANAALRESIQALVDVGIDRRDSVWN
ncbi:acyltransferase family protein [Myxococcota bacterium]|nr:acyltransferase family protein [Myxococcota bacterium]